MRGCRAARGTYAQRIARWLQATLDGDNESDDAAVCRLRAGIERWAGERADAGDDRPVLPVRAWLDRYGHVTRIDSGAAGQAALDAACTPHSSAGRSARRRHAGWRSRLSCA